VRVYTPGAVFLTQWPDPLTSACGTGRQQLRGPLPTRPGSGQFTKFTNWTFKRYGWSTYTLTSSILPPTTRAHPRLAHPYHEPNLLHPSSVDPSSVAYLHSTLSSCLEMFIPDKMSRIQTPFTCITKSTTTIGELGMCTQPFIPHRFKLRLPDNSLGLAMSRPASDILGYHHSA
jgi:hypothetical protein